MNSKNLYKRGLKFNQKGNYTKAIRDFNGVIEMNPYDSDAYSDRGVAKFHLNDLVGALDDMNISLKFDPENPYRFASRAYIRERSGDIEGAIVDYRKAIEMDPENAVSHNNLGLLEEKLGYLEMAKKRFKVADELTDNLLIEEEIHSEHFRYKAVDDLLEELNIPKEKEYSNKLILNQMVKVFTSKRDRNNFFEFILHLFKWNK